MDSPLADFEIDGDIDLTEISNTSEHTSRFHQTHRKISKKQYRAYASKMIRSRTSFVCTFSNCSVRLGSMLRAVSHFKVVFKKFVHFVKSIITFKVLYEY